MRLRGVCAPVGGRGTGEQVEGGEVVKRNGWTFKDYARHYVDARVAAGEIQERTAKSLRATLRTLAFRIDGLRLQEITPEVIEAAYVDLRPARARAAGLCRDAPCTT